jgi:RNA polymerase-binding transcription factor DksA
MRSDLRLRIEATLLAERDRATSDLHQIEEDEAEAPAISSGSLAGTRWNQADAASDVQEEEGDFITATRLSARVADIDAALWLLARDPDAFSRCGRCRSPIERMRMELVPWSRLCGNCARLNGGLF